MGSARIPGSGMRSLIDRYGSGPPLPAPDIQDDAQDIDSLVDRICYVNLRQWQLEDAIREPTLSPEAALGLIRQIQASNSQRTRTIERIDRYYAAVRKSRDAIEGTESLSLPWETHETLGQLLDSLSILYVRRFYTEQLLQKGFQYHPTNSYPIGEAIAAIDAQIALCERSFCRLRDLYVRGDVTLPPLSHFKLYGAPANPSVPTRS